MEKNLCDHAFVANNSSTDTKVLFNIYVCVFVFIYANKQKMLTKQL